MRRRKEELLDISHLVPRQSILQRRWFLPLLVLSGIVITLAWLGHHIGRQ